MKLKRLLASLFCKQYPECSYYIEVKPLLHTLRALGRFPYQLNTKGISPFSIKSKSVGYTAIFFMVQTISTLAAIWQLFSTKLLREADYDEFIFWISILTFLGQNLIVPITYWWDAPHYAQYIAQLTQLQEKFKKYGLKISGKFGKILLWLSLLNLPFCFCFIIMELHVLGEINYFILPFSSVLISSMTLLMVWCATLMKIRIMADLLLSMLCRGVHLENSTGLLSIYNGRKLWLELSETTSRTGLAISKTALSLTTSLFISFILSTYGFLSTVVINNTRTPSNMALIIVSTFTFFITFLVIDAAERTLQKVDYKFKATIMKLESESFPPYTKALQQFIQTINAKSTTIQLDGFICLNRSLFVSFISNTVTYLVVLLQFKTAGVGQQQY